MLKKILLKFKSNKAFTMYDLVVALTIFTIFSAIIGSLIVSTYKIQITTEIDEIVTLYAIEVLEYIDKIGFDDVTNELSNTLPQQFNLPEGIKLEINVTNYNPNNEEQTYIKQVNVKLKYNYIKEEKNLVFNRLKIKEVK